MSEEFVFHIDVFTPMTLPMDRLAQYLQQVAELFGSKGEVHFSRVDAGSARLVIQIDEPAVPKVSSRLSTLQGDNVPKDIAAAFRRIDDMLAADISTAKMLGPQGAIIIPFPGNTRPKALTFPTFRQQGTVEGQIVRIGGADITSHVILQRGNTTFSGIKLSRELAREMANLLYGPPVRLHGEGRWARTSEGAWKLEDFTVDRCEILDDAPLKEVLANIRSISNNGLMTVNTYEKLMDLRNDGEVH